MGFGVLVFAIHSCTNSKESEVKEKETPQKIDGFVASDKDFVLTPKKRPEMWVLGREYTSKPETLNTLIIGTARDVNQIIVDNKCIIKGPIMAIYDRLPVKGKEQKIFVGIPTNKKLSSGKYQTRVVAKGKFHKAQTNASIGESAGLWLKVSERLIKDGFKVQPPFVEYPSDTRNAEMTTVVTQANLLIPYLKK